MHVTLSQARYLITMYHMRDRERSMSKIASSLGVSKPSVTNMINLFIEKGMVKKGSNFVPTLTVQGKKTTEKILQKHAVLKGYFLRELAIPEEQAGEDALIFLFDLSEKSVGNFIKKIEMETARNRIDAVKDHTCISSFKGILEDGIYVVEFTVFRKKDGGISMGNKGFLHPAKLVVVQGSGVLSLSAIPVAHKALLGDVLRGRLARFFYWNGENYTEVEEQDGAYAFPVMDMKWSYDQEKHLDYGTIEIKVQANVGILNMPESAANLTVYFNK